MVAGSRRAGALVVAALTLPGCAQIQTSTELRILPGKGEPRVIGQPEGYVYDRTYFAVWLQLGDELIVELKEARKCQVMVHVPVVREEKTIRKLDGAIYWELGLATAFSGLAVYTFARPEDWGGQAVDIDGNEFVETTGPYRIGGIFSTIAGILIVSAIVDFARAADTVTYADAFRMEPGPTTACDEPNAPVRRRLVTLMHGGETVQSTTDDQGRARIKLPPPDTGDKMAAGQSQVQNAALIVDESHAVRVTLRVPYRHAGQAHTGRTDAIPVELGRDRARAVEGP